MKMKRALDKDQVMGVPGRFSPPPRARVTPLAKSGCSGEGA